MADELIDIFDEYLISRFEFFRDGGDVAEIAGAPGRTVA